MCTYCLNHIFYMFYIPFYYKYTCSENNQVCTRCLNHIFVAINMFKIFLIKMKRQGAALYHILI